MMTCLTIASRTPPAAPPIPGDQQAEQPAQDRPAPAAAKQQELLKTFVAEFVEMTPGRGKFPQSFSMGSAAGPATQRPVRTVTFPDGFVFSMARYEVPQNLYEAVMGANPSRWKGPRNSAEMMSWSEAAAFCRQATKLLREAGLIADADEIRLPTEAEWEYCCRAGTATAYSFGDSATGPDDEGKRASVLDAYAWHTGNAAGNDPPVGALKPNAWGLYDMHGYLWEFVADAWHGTYDGAPANGFARDENQSDIPRVIRGGSWRDPHPLLTSSTRWPVPDHARSDAIGFRCVKAPRRAVPNK